MADTLAALGPAPKFAAEIRATARLAAPLAAAQVAAFGGQVVDVMLAGHFDAHVLGAVALGEGVATLPFVCLLGLTLAVAPTVARLDGADARPRIGAVFAQALWMGFFAGCLTGGALAWGGPPLLGWVGVDPGLVADTTSFVRSLSLGFPGLGVFLACRGFSDGLARPGPGLAFNLLGLILLVPLGVMLIYGRLGVPSLGAFGCGVANAATCWVQAVAFVAFVARNPRYRGLGPMGFAWPDPKVLGGLLRLGLPTAAISFMEASMFSAVALLVGRLGEVAEASHQVALNVSALFFMVPLGMQTAITVRVGQAAGRADPAGVRRAGLAGLTLTAGSQAVSTAVIVLFAGGIAALYTDQADIRAGATALLMLAAVFQFADGFQAATVGALRGLKDTRVPMAIVALAYWGVGMPLGWYLAFPGGLGARGEWMGLIGGLSVAAVLLFARFERFSRVR